MFLLKSHTPDITNAFVLHSCDRFTLSPSCITDNFTPISPICEWCTHDFPQPYTSLKYTAFYYLNRFSILEFFFKAISIQHKVKMSTGITFTLMPPVTPGAKTQTIPVREYSERLKRVIVAGGIKQPHGQRKSKWEMPMMCQHFKTIRTKSDRLTVAFKTSCWFPHKQWPVYLTLNTGYGLLRRRCIFSHIVII